MHSVLYVSTSVSINDIIIGKLMLHILLFNFIIYFIHDNCFVYNKIFLFGFMIIITFYFNLFFACIYLISYLVSYLVSL